MATYAMTGGATGIGAAIRAQLTAAGHRVIVVDLKDADVVADLATPEGRADAVDGVRKRAPDGLDGLIPCAGVGPHIMPSSTVAKINYFGAVAIFEDLADLVEKKRGAVVFISSNSAPMAPDQQTIDLLLAGDEDGASRRIDELGDGHNAYAGSKQALTRYMRRHTSEYAGRGVRLNAVAPGYTVTPLNDAVEADERFGQAMKDFAASIPIGRSAQPDDIANVVRFLLSDEAGFICGSMVFVDGGHDAMLRPDQF